MEVYTEAGRKYILPSVGSHDELVREPSRRQLFRDNISVKLWKKLGHSLNRILQVEGREEFVRLSAPDGQK